MKLSRTASLSSVRGFTLLELLVATAIGAIVLLVINATLFGALRLQRSTQDRVDRALVLTRSLDQIQQDLAGLMLPGGTFGGALQTTPATTASSLVQAFNGGQRISPDFNTATARVDGWNPFSEVQTVAYYLAPENGGGNTKNLVRVVTRNLLPAQDVTPDAQILLRGLTDASVSFYDGTSWNPTWDSTATSTMPSAIKFSLTFAKPDGSSANTNPVELVVPIVVMTPTSLSQTTAGASSS